MKRVVKFIILFTIIAGLSSPATAFLGIFWETEEIGPGKTFFWHFFGD